MLLWVSLLVNSYGVKSLVKAPLRTDQSSLSFIFISKASCLFILSLSPKAAYDPSIV